MTSQQLVDNGRITAVERSIFSSSQWLSYFENNWKNKARPALPEKIALADNVRQPIIRSLQRFQIGESGDGTYLKKFAAASNDPIYEQCIDLFVKEENTHATILAQMISGLDGQLITWHWSNLLFTNLRRMVGLKTELFVLLIAEIIGKCFYKVCADNLEDRAMKDTFTAIVMDEIFHLEFHSTFMRKAMHNYSHTARRLVYFGWYALFFGACVVFIADHRAALKALKVTPTAFFKDCMGTFDHAAAKSLL
ncbi:MAG: hypothetical protein JST01_06940 [Cyanobacteria bacterium SZAS TMP-1]|nr:hypothetical protein [Cyanobacteria bacterium SZAS TMP-1]